MPRLLVQSHQKISTKQKTTVPFSPFQKLIHLAMESQKLSGRALAAKLTAAGAIATQSTVWTWLHTSNGHPGTRSFKAAHALALAKVLGIPHDKILTALDQSRHIYTRKEAVTPASNIDGLAALEEIIRSGNSRYVRRDYVLNRIQMIRRGCST